MTTTDEKRNPSGTESNEEFLLPNPDHISCLAWLGRVLCDWRRGEAAQTSAPDDSHVLHLTASSADAAPPLPTAAELLAL